MFNNNNDSNKCVNLIYKTIEHGNVIVSYI
jgi:hypothetical protein